MQHQSAPEPANAPRFDIYFAIHKALRAMMSDTLNAVGRMDSNDAADVNSTLTQLRELLRVCDAHLHKENQFVHPALEKRRPGSSARVADEHIEHEHALANLHGQIADVENADAATRGELALRLYRQLAIFVAENFEHMQIEESEHNAALWSAYSDAELLALENAIIASIKPEEMAIIARWMLSANNHDFRVAMLSGMRAGAPKEVFEGMLAIARANLNERDWRKLSAALQLAIAA